MKFLVTGGLGLVGVNYAMTCLRRGDDVVVLDNSSRGESCTQNAKWLMTNKGRASLKIIIGDVSDTEAVDMAVDGIDAVVHAAAQVSIDQSMNNPALDFQWNTVGTFNLLDALRRKARDARMVFMASNKVYDLEAWPVEMTKLGYRWSGRGIGPSEAFPFHTGAKEPYGASKIAGLYYTRAFAKLYDMPLVIAIPSGMYGPRQYGKAEQGWLGWFAIATSLGLPITIRGDGHQVRDMLHVSDVCDALDVLIGNAPTIKGELFNLGGGPRNAISLLGAIDILQEKTMKKAVVQYAPARPMDDKVFITNIEKMIGMGWYPHMSIEDGIVDVCQWISREREALEKLYSYA